MIPHLGANCPACGAYNSAAETACWSCHRPISNAAPAPSNAAPAPAAIPSRSRRRIAGLVLAGALTATTVGFASEFLIPGPPVAIEVVPAFVKVAPGEVATFRADAVDARGHSVTPELTWTTDGGSVSGGSVTVPTKAGAYRVTATTANGVTAGANVLVEPGPASRIDLKTSGTVKPSELASLSATVFDSYGNVIAPPRVTWSVSPPGGSIDAEGNFRTRTVGTYTIEARSENAVGTTNVIVACPPTHNDAFRGVTFSVVCGATGDIWIAGTMSASDTKTVLATIDRDVTDLEKDFALQMPGRFRMYAYATSRSFAAALAAIFPGAGGDVNGLYVPPDAIVVDWEASTTELPQTTIRHELTHLFIERAGGRLGGREIPAWFNEGLATVEEYAIAGSDWEAVSDRYCAASAAAIGTMPSLASMTSLKNFQALDGRIGYIVGAQAVRFMEDDLGLEGIRKMLTSVAVGHFWDDAYREASGKSWEAFTAAFPGRLRALAPRYPGVAFATDTPEGAGVSYVVYGYDAGSAVRVDIDGPRFAGGATRTANANGCNLGFLGSTWPSGTYTFTASGRAGTVNATLRK